MAGDARERSVLTLVGVGTAGDESADSAQNLRWVRRVTAECSVLSADFCNWCQLPSCESSSLVHYSRAFVSQHYHLEGLQVISIVFVTKSLSSLFVVWFAFKQVSVLQFIEIVESASDKLCDCFRARRVAHAEIAFKESSPAKCQIEVYISAN